MIAFQRNNGQFIYFDAITSFNRSYSASVSKSPISSGGNVSDHITKENPQFSFNAVLSNGGWSNAFNTSDSIGNFLSGNDIRFFNGRPYVSAVRVSLDVSRFTKYLPDSFTQFFSSATPTVVVDDRSEGDYVKQMEDALRDIVLNKEVLTLYEFDANGMLRGEVSDIVVVGVEFSEDADSGDAINASISCEKIFKTTSQSTSIPKGAVQNDVTDKASGTASKGQVGPEGAIGGNEESKVPAKKASGLSKTLGIKESASVMVDSVPKIGAGFQY